MAVAQRGVRYSGWGLSFTPKSSISSLFYTVSSELKQRSQQGLRVVNHNIRGKNFSESRRQDVKRAVDANSRNKLGNAAFGLEGMATLGPVVEKFILVRCHRKTNMAFIRNQSAADALSNRISRYHLDPIVR